MEICKRVHANNLVRWAADKPDDDRLYHAAVAPSGNGGGSHYRFPASDGRFPNGRPRAARYVLGSDRG